MVFKDVRIGGVFTAYHDGRSDRMRKKSSSSTRSLDDKCFYFFSETEPVR